jgi:hypothetical protein
MVDSLVSFMRSSIVLLSRGLTTALLRMDSVKLKLIYSSVLAFLNWNTFCNCF